MSQRPIRVLIVEDSRTVSMMLEEIVRSDPRLHLVASVPTAEEALKCLATLKPDVISLDIRLPGIDGLEATRRIMAQQPTPIVVVAASVDSADLNISMNALRAGAVAVLQKPSAETAEDYAAIAARLCRQLIVMSEVPVIRQRRRVQADAPAARTPHRPPSARQRDGFAVLGIVASTGGPNAVVSLLQGLQADYPLPIMLVQHMTGSFLPGFASWLGDVCPFTVEVARDGAPLRVGQVCVAGPDRHLTLDGDRVRLTDGPLVDGQKPSGTVLLESLAQCQGDRAIGVVLTGMGEDGARGAAAIHAAGGYTIAEDRSTAVVYGMPAATVRLGAASEELPLPRIGPRLRQLVPGS